MTEAQYPDLAALYETVDATWPAAAFHRKGPWVYREGRGGGKRVSAATAEGPVTEVDISDAEAAMAGLGQTSLFMIRDGDDALDAMLGQRGYRVVDPVVIYLAPVAGLADPPAPKMTAFALWPPLQIGIDIWADAGTGPERIAVMERAPHPKTAVLGRMNDRASGIAFVAVHGNIAMLHALEVVPAQRRQGSANNILRRAAEWAQDHGADWFSLVVTEANDAARRVYASQNMQVVGHYHYRMA